VLAACSRDQPKEPEKKGAAKSMPVMTMAENSKHPLARHIEVAGLRMSEKSGGKLSVRMVVINHSQADISDLGLELSTPACTLPVKVGSLGPEESKDITAECTTTLRVYELPDWQFVRPSFKITAPSE
jgi:hypothetical protein